MDPVGIPQNTTLDVFEGYNGTTKVFKVQLVCGGSGTCNVSASLLDNGTTWSSTGTYAIPSDSWSAIEISYKAVTIDGSMTLWVNGVSEQTLSKISNDTRTVTSIRLGAPSYSNAGDAGTIYIDNFESRRYSYIGTLPAPDVDVAQPPVRPGWVGRDYAYGNSHTVSGYTYSQPHAVVSLTKDSDQSSTGSYTYDANGNMTCRVEDGVTYNQIYNAENRLSSVKKLSSGSVCGDAAPMIDAQWDFSYDGDGTRVQQIYTVWNQDNPQTVASSATSAYFMGGLYEMTGTSVKKYYAIAGMTVALNDGTGLQYLLTDHLGSVVAVTNASGGLVTQQRYLPFGGTRTLTSDSPITQTDYGYTGQRSLDGEIGLVDYKFRFYDDLLQRFISPDNIIPDQSSPQTWNRYSYAGNSPIVHNDPSGHCIFDPFEFVFCVLVAAAVVAEAAPVIDQFLSEEGPEIEDVAAATLEEAQPAIEEAVARVEQTIAEDEQALEQTTEPLVENESRTLYHATNTSGADSIMNQGIDLDKGRLNLDFNPSGRPGFYLTSDLEQAQEWALKKWGSDGAIVQFTANESELSQLNGQTFSEASPEWENFVYQARTGALDHLYDYVEGPMLKNPGAFLQGASAIPYGNQFAVFTQQAVNVIHQVGIITPQ